MKKPIAREEHEAAIRDLSPDVFEDYNWVRRAYNYDELVGLTDHA